MPFQWNVYTIYKKCSHNSKTLFHTFIKNVGTIEKKVSRVYKKCFSNIVKKCIQCKKHVSHHLKKLWHFKKNSANSKNVSGILEYFTTM